MQKQHAKKRNIKKKLIKYRLRSFFNKRIRRKRIKRIFDSYRLIKTKNYARLGLVVKPNNIFCYVSHNQDSRYTRTYTSAMFKTKMTKKRIKSNLFPIMNKFYYILRKRNPMLIAKSRFVVFNIVAPSRMKKKLIRHLKKTFFKNILKRKRVFLNVKSLKVFNGCTVKKQKRKKRKGFRILK